ncbi:MAG TPA: thioesterase family protein [Streptosporangiaceae bacterium]|nr:thioesterase family protein [Streptosporangiaceae bacterium]
MGRITTAREGIRADPWVPGRPIAAPLRLHETGVASDWADYNGHMSESAYLLVFGDSADAFFRYVGVDEDYRASGRSLFTAETHLRHLGEARAGDRLRLTLQVLGVDAKRLRIAHEMRARDDALVSTAEQLLLHVEARAGTRPRVAPFPAGLAARLEEVRAAHAALPVPGYAGRSIGFPGG